MEITRKVAKSGGIRFFIQRNGREVSRAYLYLLTNDLHSSPFGFLEDVFVEEPLRGQGLGTQIVKAVIAEAKARGCYKLIATSRHSRPRVQELYKKIGFRNHGTEFRINF